MKNITERIAIYPGTFDPITNGHIDIIQRALILFDKVIICIAVNSSKCPLFSLDERIDLVNHVTRDNANVEVDSFDGLLINFARKHGATALIRGLRAISDFEYEFQMALMNRKLAKKIETVFLMPNEKYTYLNSTIIKEISRLGGDVSCFVPQYINKRMREKYGLDETDH